MKPIRVLSLVSGCLFLLPACGGDSQRPARPRNVVLIVADTLRADRLGCYGYERATSPAIDALAMDGVLWENCHSQASWTLPSMISLMAGVPVTRLETALPDIAVLAETLSEHGMATAAFIANPTVGVDRGFERGFEHFDMRFRRAPGVAGSFESWYRDRRSGSKRTDAGFFAWVQFIDTHAPYEPLEEDDVFHGPRPGLERLEPRWRAEAPRVPELSPGLEGLSEDEAVQAMNEDSNLYDGEVRAVDRGVRQVIEALCEAGEYDETLIIFCSDHGEMLYEQFNFPRLIEKRIEKEGGLPGGVKDLFSLDHRPWFYEQLWRTPLIIVGPGMPRGERRSGLAANLDIYPTVVEALELPLPEHLDGESLFGGREPLRELVFAYGFGSMAVLDRSGSKLVKHVPKLYNLPDEAPSPLELFHLRRDPEERENLADAAPDTAQELLDSIEDWRVQGDREVVDTTTERAMEVLKRMGYVDGGG